MTFQLFTDLFSKVDAITATFVTEMSARAIATITPIVSVGLTLSFMIYGWLIMRGVIDMPVTDFFNKSLRIVIITSIALAGGLYQTAIMDSITTLPDQLISALIINPTTAGGAASSIDQAADKGFTLASKAFDHAGFFVEHGITYCVFGVIIVLTTGVFIALGGAALLLTKLVIAVLVSLGPLFIIALLWQPTAKFFDLWVTQILSYILLVVLYTALFGLMLDIYGSYMADMQFDGIQNVTMALGGAVVLSIAMVIILIQIPSIASGLAGGSNLSYLRDLNPVHSRSLAQTVMSLTNNSVTRSAVRAGSNQGKRALVEGGAAIRGYFKGSLAGKK